MLTHKSYSSLHNNCLFTMCDFTDAKRYSCAFMPKCMLSLSFFCVLMMIIFFFWLWFHKLIKCIWIQLDDSVYFTFPANETRWNAIVFHFYRSNFNFRLSKYLKYTLYAKLEISTHVENYKITLKMKTILFCARIVFWRSNISHPQKEKKLNTSSSFRRFVCTDHHYFLMIISIWNVYTSSIHDITASQSIA